ncbi:MAG: 2-C-methyl-D-erythritol 4-phosphate cytidylyltransferase [Candidatus Kryptoniota bacterium]
MGKKIGVVIPAAGVGTRLGGVSKPLIEIGGQTLIGRLLNLFGELKQVETICVAVSRTNIIQIRKIVESLKLQPVVQIIEGGIERPLSIKNAFDCLGHHLDEDDLICIHDAARPLLSKSDLEKVIDAGWQHDAAFLATKVKDTLKVVDDKNFCVSTIDRSRVYAAQTPQVMKAGLLSRAYKTVTNISDITDEIMLMEKIGVKAFVVEPHHLNLKLTTPEDLELIKKLIS